MKERKCMTIKSDERVESERDKANDHKSRGESTK
jgi:hypothetical protein